LMTLWIGKKSKQKLERKLSQSPYLLSMVVSCASGQKVRRSHVRANSVSTGASGPAGDACGRNLIE
jgi:hypothetical protein